MSPLAFAQTSESNVAQQEEAQRAHLVETSYGSRPIESTYFFLGEEFIAELLRLGPEETFLEAGAGAASSLIGAYLGQFRAEGREPATTVALGLESPHPAVLRQMQAMSARHRHLHGRFIESYRPEEIGRVHLMADQYGPMSYTARPHAVLEAEANLLAPGGRLYTHFTTRTRGADEGGDHSSRIVDSQGRNATREWLESVRGVEIIHASVENHPDIRVERFGLRRTGEARVVAPELTTRHFVAGSPPTRVFEARVRARH